MTLGLPPIYRAWLTRYDILQATIQKAAKPVKAVAIGPKPAPSAFPGKLERRSITPASRSPPMLPIAIPDWRLGVADPVHGPDFTPPQPQHAAASGAYFVSAGNTMRGRFRLWR